MNVTKAEGILLVVGLAAGMFAVSVKVMPVEAASGGEAAPVAAASGADTYASRCAMCHGEHMQGNLPAFPPLIGVGRKLSQTQIIDQIHKGKGSMPPFPKIQGEELTGLVRFITADTLAPGAGVVAGTAAVGVTVDATQTTTPADAGALLFRQSCAFCHGRDAAGGESGPDLTRSKLVLSDVGGNKISEVVHNGRQTGDKKMPAFNFSDQETQNLVAFIHSALAKAVKKPGARRGVDVSDLQTGDVEAGKRYFNGVGTCSTCHSPTGDLKGVASRYEGLQLEEQMLYPRGAKSKGTVTLPNGQKVTGTVAYQDEFTVGLKDADGVYHSWSLNKVNFVLDAPVKMHAKLFGQYTDKDIHDLMAYIQTLR